MEQQAGYDRYVDPDYIAGEARKSLHNDEKERFGRLDDDHLEWIGEQQEIIDAVRKADKIKAKVDYLESIKRTVEESSEKFEYREQQRRGTFTNPDHRVVAIAREGNNPPLYYHYLTKRGERNATRSEKAWLEGDREWGRVASASDIEKFSTKYMEATESLRRRTMRAVKEATSDQQLLVAAANLSIGPVNSSQSQESYANFQAGGPSNFQGYRPGYSGGQQRSQ